MGSIIAVIIAVLNNRSLFLFANVKMLGEKESATHFMVHKGRRRKGGQDSVCKNE